MMNLLDSTYTDVSSVKIDSYKVGERKLAVLEKILDSFLDTEYWNPEFQAWWPFIETYLTSGVNSELSAKYYSTFVNKVDFLQISGAPYSLLFAEILKMKNTSGCTVFDDFLYKDICDFCEVQCKFFIATQKKTAAQLYVGTVYVQTLEELLDLNTWRATMCALVLYRHCQIDEFKWPQQTTDRLGAKISEWITTYENSYNQVLEFIGDTIAVYDWYNPKVLEVVKRVWDTALMLYKRPLLMSKADVYSLSQKVSSNLVKYVNSCPAVYDDPFKEQTVWDSMSSLFYAPNPEDPHMLESGYKALCVPRRYFKKMCNTLYDFYWVVQDGLLTERMKTKKEMEILANENCSVTIEQYLDDIYSRGFPVL